MQLGRALMMAPNVATTVWTRMSIPSRLIRLSVYSLTRCTVMTSANSISILETRAMRRDTRWVHALRTLRVSATAIVVRLKALAPYALIELILPGGSVMALLLWLYRRRKVKMALAGCRGASFRSFDGRSLRRLSR
jgi:hypothetical protein